jgi:hypothetical protein
MSPSEITFEADGLDRFQLHMLAECVEFGARHCIFKVSPAQSNDKIDREFDCSCELKWFWLMYLDFAVSEDDKTDSCSGGTIGIYILAREFNSHPRRQRQISLIWYSIPKISIIP